MKTPTPQLQAASQSLLGAYREHLLQHAGLQASTCQDWTFLVGRFLNAHFKPKTTQFDWATVNPLKIWDFFRAQAQDYAPARLQALATALRSFFRFLYVSERHAQDLSEAIPRIADPGREDLPDYLSEAELNQVLQSVNQRTGAGQRELAVLLCLARLGLRAGEVAQLNLEDVDWRAGVIHLRQTKSRQERLLPLPQDVGQALVRYLRPRPTGAACRRIFLSLRDGGPVGTDGISKLAQRVLKRAAIACARPGAHVFRHSVASHMVQKGASLKAIADWLGHRSLSTTQLYAKVNLPMLRTVAQPWPAPEVQP